MEIFFRIRREIASSTLEELTEEESKRLASVICFLIK